MQRRIAAATLAVVGAIAAAIVVVFALPTLLFAFGLVAAGIVLIAAPSAIFGSFVVDFVAAAKIFQFLPLQFSEAINAFALRFRARALGEAAAVGIGWTLVFVARIVYRPAGGEQKQNRGGGDYLLQR